MISFVLTASAISFFVFLNAATHAIFEKPMLVSKCKLRGFTQFSSVDEPLRNLDEFYSLK